MPVSDTVFVETLQKHAKAMAPEVLQALVAHPERVPEALKQKILQACGKKDEALSLLDAFENDIEKTYHEGKAELEALQKNAMQTLQKQVRTAEKSEHAGEETEAENLLKSL